MEEVFVADSEGLLLTRCGTGRTVGFEMRVDVNQDGLQWEFYGANRIKIRFEADTLWCVGPGLCEHADGYFFGDGPLPFAHVHGCARNMKEHLDRKRTCLEIRCYSSRYQ